jgi:hypothetical protein
MRQALPEIDTYVPVPSDYDRAMIPNLDRGYRGLLGLVAQGDGT